MSIVGLQKHKELLRKLYFDATEKDIEIFNIISPINYLTEEENESLNRYIKKLQDNLINNIDFKMLNPLDTFKDIVKAMGIKDTFDRELYEFIDFDKYEILEDIDNPFDYINAISVMYFILTRAKCYFKSMRYLKQTKLLLKRLDKIIRFTVIDLDGIVIDLRYFILRIGTKVIQFHRPQILITCNNMCCVRFDLLFDRERYLIDRQSGVVLRE